MTLDYKHAGTHEGKIDLQQPSYAQEAHTKERLIDNSPVIATTKWILAADLVADMLSLGDKPTIPEDFPDLVFGPSSLTLRHQGKHLGMLLLTWISCFYNKEVTKR
jgi:hypothetical protein